MSDSKGCSNEFGAPAELPPPEMLRLRFYDPEKDMNFLPARSIDMSKRNHGAKKPGYVHLMEMTPERQARVTTAVNEVIQLVKKLAPDQFEGLAILDLAAQYIREKYHISR
jgi:hypothetical protein